MARMIVLYRTPKDSAAFDEHYFGTHIPIAKRLPGLRRYEVSRGPVVDPAGGSEFHMVATLYFDDLAAIEAALASPEGKATAADRENFAPDPADAMRVLFDSREV